MLDLTSKLLKRKIYLISLFPVEKDEKFEPPMPTSSRTYYLLGCNKAHYEKKMLVFSKMNQMILKLVQHKVQVIR